MIATNEIQVFITTTHAQHLLNGDQNQRSLALNGISIYLSTSLLYCMVGVGQLSTESNPFHLSDEQSYLYCI
ncbi:hypothetical protein DERP_013501 [Dermatophagoides pteronyssinus]|uniref:Uncharacterized protein n=1 Tax=Dermatophagoides pteronyssinus TaxID=6956 RepID=A0ABQ8IXW9_DERPT|nr:hypothetical protein DERP_013501 [Dermatophagoides pteronyssinus]